MKIIVNDANILIDLVSLGLVSHFFDLPFIFHVTFLVYNEIDLEQQLEFEPYVFAGLLVIHHPNEHQLLEIQKIKNKFKALSVPDCSAFVHAKSTNGILVTSDKSLRKCASTLGVEYHGHLWVLDHLVEHQVISPELARSKLISLRESNKWLNLPDKECLRLLKQWD